MEEKIDDAIVKVLGMVRTNMNPDEVQKVTQAALNLSHCKLNLEGAKPPKKGAGAS